MNDQKPRGLRRLLASDLSSPRRVREVVSLLCLLGLVNASSASIAPDVENTFDAVAMSLWLVGACGLVSAAMVIYALYREDVEAGRWDAEDLEERPQLSGSQRQRARSASRAER
ncbi:hypothetical protein [Nesterenkonia sp. F]|uniref:hypothetical protein n=1 Tax=Nesterenkonia sp. F TaxID=795955 RepID=UPI000255C821|nr:hypothetical protein [Nesterenkonia sp. F]